MRKFLPFLATALMLLFSGCTQFDDSRIWDKIDELEDLYDDLDGRLEKLEEECEKMNTNIEALQTLVAALQANDTITSIAPIKQGDEVIGYTITFSQSEPITIYHGNDGADGEDGKDGAAGTDGKDGYTPTIGVAKDSDENYYWTLDGEWLLDESGNKIKANGTDGADGEDGAEGNNGANGADGKDGKDGITPQLEIRDGYWYISYDNGTTWKELGKATGEDGEDGADGADGTNGTNGDSFFQSVTWDEEYAYFTLSDGTVIKIPLASDSEAEEGDLPPNNEIWYTSSDGTVVTPYSTGVFGANIVSNTYENGQGVIVFDGEVTSIGYAAFAYCSSLTSVTIPDGVTSIGDGAFAYCSSLIEFKGKFASEDGRCLIIEGKLHSFAPAEITEYTIPDGITSIGYAAFCGCSSLASVTIGDSVTQIGGYAFDGCSSLASVTIPDSVTSIGNYAFAGCWRLASVTIPDSVTSIGERAFYDCSSLTNINIPDSVTSIGEKAFYYCTSLASVYCKPTTPPSGGYDMFYNNAGGRKIYVPTASVDAYKAASYWSDYADYIEGYDF